MMMIDELRTGTQIPRMKFGSGGRRFLFLLPVMIFLPYLLSVLNTVDPPKKHNMKADHLVLGLPAGQGLQNRLHCEGTKALNKTHHTAPQSPKSGENVSFVTAFTIYNSSENNVDKKSPNLVTIGNTSYTKLERSMAVLASFINFIQAFLTARLEEQNKHVQGQKKHYIFTDSDVAVVDDLGQLFDKYPSFHLALTFRNNKDQPLNSGFIAVRGTAEGLQRAKVFLENVLEAYTTKYMKASRMLGDQLALAWVVRSHPSFDARRFSKPVAFSEEINGASILFLPCASYNWTPPEGSRKRLMLEAWNFFHSSSNMDDMLCLVLGSGRTKYDF
ncbi:putative cytochrome P450 6a20 [Bienertia sinuspersici]